MLGKKVKINFKNKDNKLLLQFDGSEGIITDFNEEKIFVNFQGNKELGLAFNIEDIEVYPTGKRQRVFLYRNPTDMMFDLTVCRNCGRPVLYGKLVNNTGHDACPDCYESLRINIEKTRKEVYELYANNKLHLYVMSDKDYKAACNHLLNKQEEFITEERKKVTEQKVFEDDVVLCGIKKEL